MYGEEEEEVFLGRSVTQHKNVSDDTAHSIDEEIRVFIDRNYDRAKTILTENMDKLNIMAEALIKYETIDSDQIDDIMNGNVPKPPADWDDSEPKSGDGLKATDDAKTKDEGKGTIGGPAGQH
jgi:cell division protease FtsH